MSTLEENPSICFYVEVNFIDTLCNAHIVYGNLCLARLECCLYQRTNMCEDYTYDFFYCVESGEEVKNDLVTDQLYKYFCRHPKVYRIKRVEIPEKFEPDTFFVFIYFDDETSDDESSPTPSSVEAKSKKKKRKLF